jgi:hypothetical protein
MLEASGESSGRVISSKISNLNKSQNDGQEVDLRIALPDKSICSLNIRSNATTDEVYAALAEKLQLDAHISGFFYLFEVIDNSFGKNVNHTQILFLGKLKLDYHFRA